jgi:hypothetical protein
VLDISTGPKVAGVTSLQLRLVPSAGGRRVTG